MAPTHRAKRRKSVPSEAMKAMDEAERQAEKKKKKKKKRGKKRSGALEVERRLKSTHVEAAHERAQQARATCSRSAIEAILRT